jgi:hypothetical protein
VPLVAVPPGVLLHVLLFSVTLCRPHGVDCLAMPDDHNVDILGCFNDSSMCQADFFQYVKQI